MRNFSKSIWDVLSDYTNLPYFLMIVTLTVASITIAATRASTITSLRTPVQTYWDGYHRGYSDAEENKVLVGSPDR